jgi:RimJ/RimL family protein N-acetyltransferase
MGVYTKRIVQTKSGLEVEIEHAKKEDAKSLLEHGQTITQEHEYQAMFPDEFKITLEDELKFIDTYRVADNRLALVARVDGEVIGMVNLQPLSRLRKRSHLVGLGAGVAKEYRNSGLGTKLMECAIEWIEKETSYEKLEVRVLSTNERAIHLYKKLGCTEEARRVREFKFSDGDYRDDVVLVKFFERA